MIYLKLMAKRRMMSDTLRCFLISVLPFLTLCLLVITNYYLPIFLKKTIFGTDNFLLVFFIILSIVISFCLWKSVCLVKEGFFLMKTNHRKVKFFKVVGDISLKQYVTNWKVSVLKALLCVSWSAVYFSPCLIVSLLLLYSYKYENYGENVHITLFENIHLPRSGVGFCEKKLSQESSLSFLVSCCQVAFRAGFVQVVSQGVDDHRHGKIFHFQPVDGFRA